MIKNIILLGILSLTLFSCSNKNKVEIKGEIKNADKQTAYLEQVNVNDMIIIDSTKIGKNGTFKFKTHVELPTFYNIKIGKNESITILAEPEKNIEISGELENLGKNYWVDGSENSLMIKLLNFQLDNTKQILDSLRKVYATIPPIAENTERRNEIAALYDTTVVKQIDFSRDFILKNAISPVAYYALYQQFDKDNYILEPTAQNHSYKVVASSLKAMFPESQYTRAILKHLEQINKDLQALKMREFIVNSDNDLPEIKLPNANGDTIALSSLKGKYILLDFTALNAQGSTQYTREMKNIYAKYKSRGLEIYQVCLDENKIQWENQVKKNDINWICVYDAYALKSRAAQVWNIQNIPANYIINKQYEIVGKNLSGQRLSDRLNDIIK